MKLYITVLAVASYFFYAYRYCIKENLILKKIFGWLTAISLAISLCIFLDYVLCAWSYKITKNKQYIPVTTFFK